MSLVLPVSEFQKNFDEFGFATLHFPQFLQNLMLLHIEKHIRDLAISYFKSTESSNPSIVDQAMSIPDSIWSVKMSRAFRIFPPEISDQIFLWADRTIRTAFGKTRSAINLVYPQEAELNPKVSKNDLAIYWRCVRPGKPDAGRAHRDASFWVLEFEDGYDPKVPFAFDYLKDCIKVWIPLKGCKPLTTLQMIPRSHKMEIPTVTEQTEYGKRPTIESKWLAEHQHDFISPIELSKNSCVVFDMNLVHRGPIHNNDDLRISAELCLIFQ